jgi:hypothetical protein
MKKVLIVTVLLFISCQNNKKKENEDKSTASNAQIESVKDLSHSILIAQKNGDFYILTNKEATPEMIAELNESVQKESYNQIKNTFGVYKSLKFHSIEEVVEGKTYKVFRFKGDFEFGLPVEVRSVINQEGKLAGFFVKPWQNKL